MLLLGIAAYLPIKDHRSMEKPKAKAGFPSNGMIPSSSISQQHPHEHPQIAAVEIAWINDSLPLRLACVRMTNDELLLTGTIGDPPKF